MDNSTQRFVIVDYVVFGCMLLLSTGIGLFYAIKDRKQQNTEEYLLAGRYVANEIVIPSSRFAKTLMGGGTTFHPVVKRDGHYTCKGMVYTKMLYGGMMLFSGDWASPLNSSTSNI